MLLPVRSTHIAGRALGYARMGAGRAIVLLHGYPDNLQLWSAIGPLLADSFDVIAIDWPGLGRSDAWPGGATPSHMASNLVAVLDHLNVERVAVVGADMGGQPALVAAARYAARISHVIVTGSLLQWDARTSWEIALLRRFKINQFLLEHCPRVVFRRALSTFLPHGHRLDDGVREDFWESFRRPEVRRFIVRMCAGYQGTLPGLAKEYQRITAPTLAIWGERDAHFPPEHALRLREHVRHAAVKIVADGHHWMPLQLPAEFAAEVRAFLRP
jgi:pimeloyl-ACP methyl ester carboxylesterase